MSSKRKKYLKLVSDNENNPAKKTFHIKDLANVRPKTPAQEHAFTSWYNNKNLLLKGSAGSGKTFCAMYLGLYDILHTDLPQKNLYCIKSAVPTVEIGFLPGSEEEKLAVYEESFKSICDGLFPFKKSYENLKKANRIKFLSTSFLRGLTFDNTIVVVDEAQNMTAPELETVITRLGINSRIIICGDTCQTDLWKKQRPSGLNNIEKILNKMDEFDIVGFTTEDIVRSGLVKSYLIAKEQLCN